MKEMKEKQGKVINNRMILKIIKTRVKDQK